MNDLPPVHGAAVVRAIFGNSALPSGAHAGLVFDRYLRIWSGGLSAPKKAEGYQEDLRAFVDQFNRRSEVSDHTALLGEQHDRLRAITAPEAERTFRTTFRLATGLGQEHPLENGFVFDPVIGVPYLPGSSIKGLLRAQLDLAASGAKDEDRDALEEVRLALLGNDPPKRGDAPAGARQGDLIVLPAFPERWPRLAVDVINCHHPAYYQSGGRADPVDWENPNPVYFLAVDSGVDFVFRFGWRPAGDKRVERPSRVGKAFEVLAEALGILGIGAKTAVGYGVMIDPKQPRAVESEGPSGTAGGAPTPGPGTAASRPSGLDASAMASLLRAVDKGNAAAKVPELLKAVSQEQKATIAREIVKKLGRKWIEERKDKAWAAELLATAAPP